jgi:hypothetical protein
MHDRHQHEEEQGREIGEKPEAQHGSLPAARHRRLFPSSRDTSYTAAAISIAVPSSGSI